MSRPFTRIHLAKLAPPLFASILLACAPAPSGSGDDTEGALGANDSVIGRTDATDFAGWLAIDDDRLYAHLFQDQGREAGRDRPDNSKIVAWKRAGAGASETLWEGRGTVVWRVTSDADHLYFSARQEADGVGLVFKLAKSGGAARELLRTPPVRFGPGSAGFRATKDHVVMRNVDEPWAVLDKNTAAVVRTIRADEVLTLDDKDVYLATERDGKYGIYAEPLGGGAARLVTSELERPRSGLDAAPKPGFVLGEERLFALGGNFLYGIVADEPGQPRSIARIPAQGGAVVRLPYEAPPRGERERYLFASDSHVCLLSARDTLRCQDAAGGPPRKIADYVYSPGVLLGGEVFHSRRDARDEERWVYVRTKL